MTKEEARFSVMGAISMALKDPTLQQGFEIICKNLSELEETNAKLQSKIDDWQSEYIELENFMNNEIAELRKKIEKMKCCGNCAKNGHICVAEEMQGKLCGKNKDKWKLRR